MTEQTIGPGQEYYTVLRDNEHGELQRSDMLASAWSGVPQDCIAWWKSRIPVLDEGRVYWAPNDVLRNVFHYFLEQPAQQDAAYVMSLLLVRKRLLQLRETVRRDDRDWLVLYDSKQQSTIEVAEVALSAERAQTIQNELAEKLFTSQSQTDCDTEQPAIPEE